jgi:hypothetical protein
MKVDKFNKALCRTLRNVVEETLQEVAKEHGISIKVGSGSFSDVNFNFKVEASVIGKDGVALSKEAESFKMLAKAYNLEPTDLHREFTFRGDIYKIKGLSSRSDKFPILATKVSDGKTFKFPCALIAELLKTVISS